MASAEVCWLLMSLMVAVAMWARRGNYQLFVYTHHLAIGVCVTVIVHAWSAWCVSSRSVFVDYVVCLSVCLSVSLSLSLSVSLSLSPISRAFLSNLYDIGN